jgi:uncharacterized membrane protein
MVTVANQTASLANGRTSLGINVPTSPRLSGSAASLVAWRSLGHKGQDFVGTAPSRRELGRFVGTPAADPIRVYVGLDSGRVGRRMGAARGPGNGADRRVRPCRDRGDHHHWNGLGG